MTDKLPHNLLALFAPRPPLRWVPATDHAPEVRRTANVTGVADFLPALREYKDRDGYVPTESWLQMRDRKKREKKAGREKLLTEGPLHCGFLPIPHSLFIIARLENTRRILTKHALADKPNEDPNIRGDAFKTLIVARLSYDANEHDLEKEFGRFGPVERVRPVLLFLTVVLPPS